MYRIIYLPDAESGEYQLRSHEQGTTLFTSRCPWEVLLYASATALAQSELIAFDDITAKAIAKLALDAID